MSIRRRIFLTSALTVLAPLLLLAGGIRWEMTRRLSAQYAGRVASLVRVIEEDLAGKRAELGKRLAALKEDIRDDNDFRSAAVEGRTELRRYLLDYAGRAMGLMGLSMLQIQDEAGRIISSGHFRNEFDCLEPLLPLMLEAAPEGTALVRSRLPEGTFLALSRIDSIKLGNRRFSLVGGFLMDEEFLSGMAPGENLAVSLLCEGDRLSSDPDLSRLLASSGPDSVFQKGEHFTRHIQIPFVPPEGGDRLASAVIVVSHQWAPLREMVRSLEMWLLFALGTTAVGTLLLAIWMSVRISRPIRRLAEKTAALDLDKLDADFASERKDEVGALSRFLGNMTERLRASVERLRETERRATLGELARQVNHDLRNGITPIRNVIRHLAQLERDHPEDLASVFRERHSTIESSLSYLEDLSKNYSKLSTPGERVPCDLNQIVREVAAAFPGEQEIALRTRLAPSIPPVLADPTGIRRILENLIRNSRQSLGDRGGAITVTTNTKAEERDGNVVVLTVRDSGCGIEPEHLPHIFDHFYTRKKEGTGLGLSIVRRLVTDYEGTIQVSSTPGEGTLFTVVFPEAGPTEEDLHR